MSHYSKAIILSTFLASTPAFGEVSSQHANALIEMLEQNQCRATFDQVEDYFDQRFPGNDMSSLDVAVQAGRDGRIGANEQTDVITLYSEACGNAHEAQLPRLIDAISENGCSMVADEVMAVLPTLNISRYEVGFLGEVLLKTGQATIDYDNGAETLTISPEYCTPK